MEIARHIQRLPRSYIREILAASNNPECISFAGGLPAEEHFNLPIMQDAFNQITEFPHLFQYGASKGYSPLIEHIKTRDEIPPEHDVLITNGSQQGIDLISRAIVTPGDRVLMEAPCYLGAIQAFSLAQANINTIEQRTTGPDLATLESIFKRNPPKLFYCVPDFHNPTGRCWEMEERKGVAKLCETFGVLLVEDAPYREIRFNGDELPQVAEFCPENALRLNSFSKITMPGLRIGAVIGPKHWISVLETIKQATDLHTNLPLQHALLSFIDNERFKTHLSTLRSTYSDRFTAMKTALQTHLLEGVSFEDVEGGMFLWVKLDAVDCTNIAKEALHHNVAVVPGSVFYPENTRRSSHLRLNFSNCEPDTIYEGVKRLSAILARTAVQKSRFRTA